jgi:hypothetical protein
MFFIICRAQSDETFCVHALDTMTSEVLAETS